MDAAKNAGTNNANHGTDARHSADLIRLAEMMPRIQQAGQELPGTWAVWPKTDQPSGDVCAILFQPGKQGRGASISIWPEPTGVKVRMIGVPLAGGNSLEDRYPNVEEALDEAVRILQSVSRKLEGIFHSAADDGATRH